LAKEPSGHFLPLTGTPVAVYDDMANTDYICTTEIIYGGYLYRFIKNVGGEWHPWNVELNMLIGEEAIKYKKGKDLLKDLISTYNKSGGFAEMSLAEFVASTISDK
jgi:hypothetical protein